jgi:hypothetical protein
MKVLFAGPSLAGDLDVLRQSIDTVQFGGPAARGDIAKAALDGASAIGIVDGVFENTMSVWHKEILFALSLGTAVGGAASMGALRAAECAVFGMAGIGSVFRRFHLGESMDDSDVAQIHMPAELAYRPLSEPWVNIEPTLRKMLLERLIDADEFHVLSAAARQLHFKDRTYRKIFEAATAVSSERAERLLTWISSNAVDQKRIDALELVDWLIAQPDRRGAKPEWSFSDTTHWRALLDELAMRTSV